MDIALVDDRQEDLDRLSSTLTEYAAVSGQQMNLHKFHGGETLLPGRMGGDRRYPRPGESTDRLRRYGAVYRGAAGRIPSAQLRRHFPGYLY